MIDFHTTCTHFVLRSSYVRRGHVRTGELSPFPYGDGRFDVPLRDDLAFETLVKPPA